MQAQTKKRIAIVAGVGAAIGLLIYLGRRQAGLAGIGLIKPKYRFVSQRHRQAPLVGSYESGGMRMEHRRSATMPIEERVASIQDLVWKGVQDPRMRKLGLQITQHCPERDTECEIKAIYDHMKGTGPDGLKNYRYAYDIAPVKMGRNGPVEGVDLFQSARRTDEFRAGDCDDATVKIATLLAVNGITPRLRVTASTRNGEDEHIYPVAGVPRNAPSKWIAVDATLPGNDRLGVELGAGRVTDFPA